MKIPIMPVVALIKTLSAFKSALGSVVGLIIIFAYIAALVIYINGQLKKESDPAAAATSMKTAAWLAGGVTIVTILFVAFGHDAAVVDANYN